MQTPQYGLHSSHLLVAQATNMLGQYQIKATKCSYDLLEWLRQGHWCSIVLLNQWMQSTCDFVPKCLWRLLETYPYFFPTYFAAWVVWAEGPCVILFFFLAVRYYFHANICCSENGRTAENLTLSAGMPSAALFFGDYDLIFTKKKEIRCETSRDDIKVFMATVRIHISREFWYIFCIKNSFWTK